MFIFYRELNTEINQKNWSADNALQKEPVSFIEHFVEDM